MSEFKLGELYTNAFEGMPEKEIQGNMEGVSYAIEEKEYTHNLTPDELALKKSELAELRITIENIMAEKKEAMAEYNEKLKGPDKIYRNVLDAIKHKSERKQGRLYLVDDQANGMMYYFDSHGICVDARALKPQEKQTKIRSLNPQNYGNEHI